MTRLREHVPIARSAGDTRSRLEAYLSALRGKDGVARMRLRVPLVTDGMQLSLDREVCVEAERTRDDNRNDLLRISWKPEGTVVFPVFAGRLVVWSEDDPKIAFIELDGSYEPPFGAAGQAFDAVIGHRIAQQTARQLLNDLKTALEQP
jgi:hypothetical protein